MREHDDLIDQLLSIDWRLRFESFTCRERRRLEAFNRFGWNVGNCSFFQSPVRLDFGATVELTHAGTEALELAAVKLRQSWQDKDIANHEKVVTVLRKKVARDEHGAHTVMVLDSLESASPQRSKRS